MDTQRPALIGFPCPVCGLILPAGERRPMAAPRCAGSKAATGRQHAPTPMRPLVVHWATTWGGSPATPVQFHGTWWTGLEK